MKISKIFLTVAIVANLFSTAAFALPTHLESTNPVKTEEQDKSKDKDIHIDKKKCKKGKCKDEFTDPIKLLKEKKEALLKLEKEGKISKEEADKKIKKIDSRIKEIEEFNRLPVEEKRAKLIEKFKKIMDKKVKEGKISREKADELISEYTKKIQEWDGKGMPKFYHKGSKKKNR